MNIQLFGLLFAAALGAILAASLLMFVVSTTVLTYRAYRIENGTWRMSRERSAALRRWARYLTDTRWIGHAAVLIAVTLAAYSQQWTPVIVILMLWGFLGVVLKMTAALLVQWAGGSLPSSWWSRLRSGRKQQKQPS